MPKPQGRGSGGIIVVAHTHWDREWYAPFQRRRIGLIHLLDKLLELLEGESRYHSFTLDGQGVLVEDYLEIRPENEARLRRQVQAGRLFIGPWFVLADEFLVSGEALIRNLLLGQKVGARLGPVMKVGYAPDPFGHISQLPQLLHGFGIDSFIFSRGLGDEGEKLGSEFLWQAPDGTAVVAIHQIAPQRGLSGYCNAAALGRLSSYGGEVSPDLALAQARQLAAALRPYARAGFLLFNNGGDHLEPQPELPGLIAYLNAHLGEGEVLQGSYQDVVERVRAAQGKVATFSGELRGARYTSILAGVLSARMPLKQENERLQGLLERWAEAFCAAAWREGWDYPAAFLWHAWKLVLLNHPHDSICGCGIDQVHEEMRPRFAQAQQIAEYLRDESLALLASRVHTAALPMEGWPLIVFNPLSWPRTEVVTCALDLPAAPASFFAVDAAGRKSPCQVLLRRRAESGRERLEVAFLANGVPAFGYKAYALVPGEAEPRGEAATAFCRNGQAFLENSFYRVLARPNGTLHIYHQPTGRALDSVHLFTDEADAGDEYNFSPAPHGRTYTSRRRQAQAQVMRPGPVVATVRLNLDLRLPASLAEDRKGRRRGRVREPVTTEVSLYAGVDRLEFRTELENTAQDHRLRVLFPTGVGADSVMAESSFDVVRRPLRPPLGRRWAERPSRTHPQKSFLDVSDGQKGLALFNRGLPEYEAWDTKEGVVVALTLLRCAGWLSRDDLTTRPGPAGPSLEAPGAQCPGRHTFHYALQLHAGSWLEAQVYRAAHGYSAPLAVVPAARQPGALPPQLSFLTLEGDHLVLSAIKQSEDAQGLIVRLYSLAEAPSLVRLRLHWPYRSAYLVRLDETEPLPLAPDREAWLSAPARPKQILTFQFQF